MTNELKPKRNTNRLDRLSSVRLEMARIYRKVRNKRMPAEEATKHVYILREIRTVIEAEVHERIEERLVRLEEAGR